MTGTRSQRARDLAAELTALGVRAVADPAQAAQQLPCVLVAVPTLDRPRLAGGWTTTWRLLVLAPGPGTLDSWDAMDELLDQLDAHVPLTRAEPGQYQVGTELVACYVCTYTE